MTANMRTFYKITAIAALAAALFSCKKAEVMEPGTFTIADEYLTLNFTQENQYQLIPVASNVAESEWRITSSTSWCVATPSLNGAKGIMVSVAVNEEPDQRPAEVSIKVRGKAYTIKVTQLGYGPAILVNDVFVAAGGGEASVQVTANIPYQVLDPVLDEEDLDPEEEEQWLTKVAQTKALAKTDFRYNVQPNFTAGRRVALIQVQAQDRSLADVDKICTITQDIVADTASEDVMGGSEQVYAKSVIAVRGNEQKYYSWDAELNWPGAGGPALMLDGDPETYYCSPRGLGKAGDDGTEYPFEFIFEFENVSRVDYLKIYPLDNSGNQIAEFNAYIMPEGSDEYIQLNNPEVPVNCTWSDKAYTYTLDVPVPNPKYLKIEVLSTYWNLVKIKEVEFFKTNNLEINEWIQHVFTDLSCSELKSGVSKKDINQMAVVAPYLAKNVAMPLYQETYNEAEKEFRIHAYEPYSIPSVMKKRFNIRLYSELDNPTGILAKSGDTFIVCVDQVPAGHEVRLLVNGDTENGYEFNYSTSQFSQGLKAGVNVVNVAMSGSVKEGMVFIVNAAENLSEASPAVKVHILPGSGEVVGYYNAAIHDDARYKDILSRYNYKYFFLKGQAYILAAHTQQLRSAAPNSYSSGLAQLDNVVNWEKEIMGLGKDRHPEFNNHIMAVTTTVDGVHMDASDRRIRYQASALKNYATKEDVCASPWGVAHEIGHVNQPAICWESTIESSNNLFSNYVSLMCGVTESRGGSIITLANSYGKGWYQLGNTGQYMNEDAELHLRMNWQLWNYFHRCGKDPEFWHKLFDLARANPTPGMYYSMYGYRREDPGTCQLMFYEQACDAAQMDLTEFFDAWGFFVPVDATYGQYQAGIAYQVTPDMIEEYKGRVAAHNYPKAPAIQYLEDRTRQTSSASDAGYNKDIKMGHYSLFKDQTPMTTVPTYSINNRTVTIQDCSQAAAVEIRDNAGNLLYFSNLDRFDVPSRSGAGVAIDLSVAKFQAVQWDGVRKDMTRK